MLWMFIIVVVCVLVFTYVQKLKGQTSTDTSYSYTKKSTLFSPAERSFLGVLDTAIGTEYSIFGKVRVADVLEVSTPQNRSQFKSAFNKINAKHFDYVICNKNDLSILCAIELDDKSHSQRNRQDRDNFLVLACESAQLTLLRFEAKKSYSIQEVREKVLHSLGVPQLVSSPKAVEAVTLPENNTVDAPSNAPGPICPKCSAQMVKRQARTGQHAGKFFWACSTYPKCKSVQEIGA